MELNDIQAPKNGDAETLTETGHQHPNNSVGWCGQRRYLDRKLSIITLVLTMTVFVLVAVSLIMVISPNVRTWFFEKFLSGTNASVIQNRSAFPSHQNGTANCVTQEKRVCLTLGCVKAANTILESMDADIDPCDDFYNFACGGFIKTNTIQDNSNSITQTSIIHNKLHLKLQELIQANVNENDSVAIKLTKTLHTSCVDTGAIEELGLKPLKDVLLKMGGWPVVEGTSWNEDSFTWTDAIRRNRDLGYSVESIIGFSVSQDLRNSSWRTIFFNQAVLGLSRKLMLKGFEDANIQAYYGFMLDMAELLGADKNVAKEELKESLLFEIQLANISLADEDLRDITKLYNKMTLKELGNLIPDVDWVNYTNNILRAAGHQISEDELVIVTVLDFAKNLAILLKDTPKRVLANYMMWRVVSDSAKLLNTEARGIMFKFVAKLTGKIHRKPRWVTCLGETINRMGLAVGSLYVKNHFDKSSKKAALELVKNIHKEFNIMLDQVDWMDDKTKEKAKRKSEAIKYHIGYPEQLVNDTALAEVYYGLSIDRKHYFENSIKMSVFYTNYAFRKLRDQVDKNDWKKHGKAAVANAFYTRQDNSIGFSAGIFQGAFYDYDRPQYMNYGAIGSVIGHEITHGFDDEGRQFNAEGDLAEWWEAETKKNFVDRVQCMIDQYSNFTVPEVGIQINGKRTQGENIADNGGIKQARRAYERYEQKNGIEPALPGLQQYSNKQMFWIAAANILCSVENPEIMKLKVVNGVHSPPIARTNVVFGNQEQFAKDWQCSKEAGMSPLHQCAVW